MNQENNTSKTKTNTATDVKNVSVFTRGEIIAVKLDQLKRSPAAELSSRPTKSLIKARSLTKPFKARR